MPAQSPGLAKAGPGTQFLAIRSEVRWVPACAGMTESNDPWFKSGYYFGSIPLVARVVRRFVQFIFEDLFGELVG
jgi:hypothetical protein